MSGYDAVVVGAGAAGGWAAKELCEQGLSVLLLEAGPELDPEADFPATSSPERRLSARIAGLLGGQRVQVRCTSFNARTRRFFVSDRENPYTTPSGAPFNWFRGRQVGGRLHVWARVAPRISDYELGAASRDGHGVDWPLDYAELAPYYETVEEFLGLHGEPDGLAAVPDGRYVGRIDPTQAELSFRRAVADAFPDRPVISPRVVAYDPEQPPPAIRAAQATGRLTLRADAVVRRVATDPASGMATGVSFVDRHSGQVEEARAGLVVLCASAIETLRLMLNSTSSRHPAGLGNSSEQLGRNIMDHVLSGIGGPLAEGDWDPGPGPTDPYDLGWVTGVQLPRFRNLESPHPDFLRGYGLQGAVGRGTPFWYLLAHGEMLARPENRVTLDQRRTDAWGVPVARISCAASPNEEAMAADQIDAMHEMADAAGLQVRTPPSGNAIEALAFRLFRRRLLSNSGAFIPGTAAHELGGAGMGDDPKRFVLNRWGQCWDAENVIVTDGAAFPSGCWQNTTLTIMALTVRSCRHAAREYRAGRL